MGYPEQTPARRYAKGIGEAVADRTINRLIKDPRTGLERRETWAEVANRVAVGNAMLDMPRALDEFDAMHHHLRQASILMSGRHLQHGDETQPSRNMEVFTNCSTAAATFLSYYLLLNGSGVGRCYDDAMMLVDWTNMPIVQCAIDYTHADVASGRVKPNPLRDLKHFYSNRKVNVYEVPDSREGWAKAIEQIEVMAFEARFDEVLILDFNGVRPHGSPIKGMQNRPASGPGPMIEAITKLAYLRSSRMDAWEATMFADHYVAECVLVGGARRAARMATKTWRDKSVLKFIQIKRGGFLWSSNNSVTVDAEFWRYVNMTPQQVQHLGRDERELAIHARAVFEAVVEAAYHDGTGEPGFINVDKLAWKAAGIDALLDGDFAESEKFKLDDASYALTQALAKAWVHAPTPAITNPCGEIVLGSLGGYCVIADVVPYHAALSLQNKTYIPGAPSFHEEWDADAEDAFRVAARALMRVNLMDSLYKKEVKRTNRIGVGFTGIHEYAWARFGFGWKDLVNEQKSLPFWLTMSRFKNAIVDEVTRYAKVLGVTVPHTDTTVKPAGTTSKLFGLSEGAHLPSMREYLRWVQFRSDDPLIEQYRERGYPVRELKSYSGTTIVGFPTVPEICTLGMGDKLVTAAEATPEEQYQWLRLLEKYWLTGVDDDMLPLPESGNQVSYTLKYDPKVVSYMKFRRTLLEGQSGIRCCSVMPQTDSTAYEYQPEEPVSADEFRAILDGIDDPDAMKEDIGFEHVDCGTGGCPISFDENR